MSCANQSSADGEENQATGLLILSHLPSPRSSLTPEDFPTRCPGPVACVGPVTITTAWNCLHFCSFMHRIEMDFLL